MADNTRDDYISCGFFDAQEVEGSFDRVYHDSDMNMFLGLLTSDGILSNDSNNYKVTIHGTGSSYQVDVNVGSNGSAVAVIDKHWMILSNNKTFSLDLPSTYQRIDSIVIKSDSTSSERACWIELKKGTPSNTNPLPPTLINEPGSVVEYRLANIRILTGVSSLVATDIEDTRGGSECPYIHGLIDAPDTRELFDTYQAAFENAISGTIAEELDSRITDLEEELEGKPNFYYGTSDPSSSLGNNGDIYFKYES